MNVDKTTIQDLSIFNAEEENSIFQLLDFTKTSGGKEWLKFYLAHPLQSIEKIIERQQILKTMLSIKDKWPKKILNGTVMMMERYYESSFAEIPAHPTPVSAALYRITYRSDYSLIEYSVGHFKDFFHGLSSIVHALANAKLPAELNQKVERISQLLNLPGIQLFFSPDTAKKIPIKSILQRGYFLRRRFKEESNELITIFSQLDAFYSMAVAGEKLNFNYPEFIESAGPEIKGEQIFHPLLKKPVAYDITLDREKNFLFLTGANMAGKSTFIRAVGIAAYLSHLGMAIPAKSMQLTFFDGLLSNIQMTDNVAKGESYFYNEVQRIRKTIDIIRDGKNWLILIDELFKGTNVQDAMKCSTVVIKGLLKMKNALFILSTHLYEIGDALHQHSNVQFQYFETQVKNDELSFSYRLKPGISNDRLGYLILKNEGVIEMIENL